MLRAYKAEPCWQLEWRMVVRLGEVLCWAATAIAFLCIIAGVLLISWVPDSIWPVAALTAVIAGFFYLAGRAARYVLAGF